MVEKLKNKVSKMNLKKSFLGLIVAGIVFAVASGVVLYQNFGDRFTKLEETYQQQREELLQEYAESDENGKDQTAEESSGKKEYEWYAHGHESYGDEWHGEWSIRGDHNWDSVYSGINFKQNMNLTTGDKVLAGVVLGISGIWGMAYWLLCMVWAYQKANKTGCKKALWVILTLFFNMWAIIALYIYTSVKGTCKKCGYLRQKNENYCSNCGNEYQRKCDKCGAIVSTEAAFCWNCGQSMKEFTNKEMKEEE